MEKKHKPHPQSEIQPPVKSPEIRQSFDPEEPLTPEDNSDLIPEEDPFETLPEEVPPPAEGP